MIKNNNPTNVTAAFEILLEEVEEEVSFFTKIGSSAFERQDFEGVREALDHSAQLTAFREKVGTLHKEWNDLIASERLRPEEQKLRQKRQNLGSRLKKGIRTPTEAFRQPILKILVQIGGSANLNDVLDRLEKEMKNILKEIDFEPLASDRQMLRWRNSAQWARYTMTREGLLKSDTPRGIWEITDAGRKMIET